MMTFKPPSQAQTIKFDSKTNIPSRPVSYQAIFGCGEDTPNYWPDRSVLSKSPIEFEPMKERSKIRDIPHGRNLCKAGPERNSEVEPVLESIRDNGVSSVKMELSPKFYHARMPRIGIDNAASLQYTVPIPIIS